MSLSHHPNIVRNGLVAYFDAANPKSYPAGQDPYVSGVNLLFDGESLVDKSAKTQSFTNNSSVTVSTTQKKFGNSSLYFSGRTADGGSNSYLSFAANSDFGFGSGDWTVETWFYKTTPLASLDVLFDNRVGLGGAGGYVSGVALYVQAGVVKTGNNAERLAGATIATGVWNHLMISRSGNNIYLGVNGTVVSTAFSTTLHSAPQLYIGNSVVSEYAGGYMDDYRVTKGFARYTANYTVPAATFSLPGRITDLTTNKVIGTLTNGPTYSAGAITTDGVNDYIDCGNYANANFGTSNFTINMWIKTTSTTGGTILAKSTGDSANASYGWLVYLNATSSGEIGFATATAAGAFSASGNYIIRTSGASVNNGTWKMVTVVANRTSANVSIYINGVLQTLATWIFATASLATVGNITNSQILCIGNESDFNVPANAAFSAVQLYNKALTVSEVLQNYNAIKSRYGY